MKVLDVGFAKATDPASKGPFTNGPFDSPTFTSPAMTQMGVILGTAGYMAPEQARGKAVDKRADIWAWGPGDRIYFSPGWSDSPLMSMSADGGATTHVSTLDRDAGERGHWWPHALPDELPAGIRLDVGMNI